MSTFTETKVIDQITVTENGCVFYREATRILKDGEQIAQTFHRSSLFPGHDLTGQPANVVAICNAAWTDEVIAAYQAQIAQQTA
jgi:DNA-binding transcriptional LysR family regulator